MLCEIFARQYIVLVYLKKWLTYATEYAYFIKKLKYSDKNT